MKGNECIWLKVSMAKLYINKLYIYVFVGKLINSSDINNHTGSD